MIDLKRLCALALILLSSACTDPASDAFRFGLAGAPANLDPRFATDATSARINRLLYDRLVDFNDAFEPVPSLADWEQRSPTHYRFHLKTNDHPFHDGTVLTAYDVKATYDFILNPDNASRIAPRWPSLTASPLETKRVSTFFFTGRSRSSPGISSSALCRHA